MLLLLLRIPSLPLSLFESAWTGIKKKKNYHRLGGSNKRHLLLTILEAENLRLRCQVKTIFLVFRWKLLTEKKKHNRKVENYILFGSPEGRLSDSSEGQL